MPYGEIFIPGESKKEILISTYICHPSMASNELSFAYLAKLAKRFSYRILFMSIGAILGQFAYKSIFWLCVLTCLGDTNGHSLIEGIEISFFVKSAMRHMGSLRFLTRSDERQYCSPNVNLPVVTLCNTRGEYSLRVTNIADIDQASRRL